MKIQARRESKTEIPLADDYRNEEKIFINY
jgi:hypothetical protein